MSQQIYKYKWPKQMYFKPFKCVRQAGNPYRTTHDQGKYKAIFDKAKMTSASPRLRNGGWANRNSDVGYSFLVFDALLAALSGLS